MYLLFDAGGTKTRVSVSEDGRSCRDPVVFDTEKDFAAEVKRLQEIAGEMAGGMDITVLAGGVAGPFNRDRSALLNSPNLSSWVDVPLKRELENAFKVPVYLENDTALVGLGEAVSGAGKGARIAAYITVSTGVGGVRIVGNRIDSTVYGFEPGHHIIHKDEKLTLEECISGKALERRLGRPPKEVTDEAVWDEEARVLAVGLNNVAVFWSPDVIVLGGSMMVKTPGIALARVEDYFKKIMKIFPETPALKLAELGDFGGLYGSLAYIIEKETC